MNAMCTKTERSPPAGCQIRRRFHKLLLMSEQHSENRSSAKPHFRQLCTPRALGPAMSGRSATLIGQEARQREKPYPGISTYWPKLLTIGNVCCSSDRQLCSRAKAQSRFCGSVRWIANNFASP